MGKQRPASTLLPGLLLGSLLGWSSLRAEPIPTPELSLESQSRQWIGGRNPSSFATLGGTPDPRLPAWLQPGQRIFLKRNIPLGGASAQLESELLSSRLAQDLGLIAPRAEAVRIQGQTPTFVAMETFDSPRISALGQVIDQPGPVLRQMAPDQQARVLSEVRRAQLFDVWIGNWDREQKNFRWLQTPDGDLRTLYFDHDVALAGPSSSARNLTLPMNGALDLPPPNRLENLLPQAYTADTLGRRRYWSIWSKNPEYQLAMRQDPQFDDALRQARQIQADFPDSVLRARIAELPDSAFVGVDPTARRAELFTLLSRRRDELVRVTEYHARLSRPGGAAWRDSRLKAYQDAVPASQRRALDLPTYRQVLFLDDSFPESIWDRGLAERSLDRFHVEPGLRNQVVQTMDANPRGISTLAARPEIPAPDPLETTVREARTLRGEGPSSNGFRRDASLRTLGTQSAEGGASALGQAGRRAFRPRIRPKGKAALVIAPILGLGAWIGSQESAKAQDAP